MSALLRLIVEQRDEGQRIDRLIAERTELSRRRARKALTEGAIICNQKILRVQSREVHTGDVVDLNLPGDEVGTIDASPIPEFQILHDDRWLLIADKPAGVLSQSAENSDEMAFDEMVLLDTAGRLGRRPHLRLFHRLDRLTSGAVLFAANPHAQAPLARSWAANEVDRTYLAITGVLPGWQATTVDEPIVRDPDHAWRFCCGPGGRNARTDFELVGELSDGRALVRCRLNTGRTHQVRVHLSHLGTPVLGDRLYGGGGAPGVLRPLLHAHTIGLPHPDTGRPLDVVATPPADFADLIGDALET